ncbi:unnamed protein product [Parnassius apollo]|uniref:(apollo) hypothetical protein n=1 Tax=Parnassius apollo TaxID=110799 RepID=A0A8S3XMS4_PARAO|nr:unnamed protein product [Parnassius apollo]
MKKSLPRGSRYEEQMTSFEGVDFTAVSWKDNKPITFLSSYVDAEPASLVERFDKVNKTRIKITHPRVIKEHNAHMGGVDLLDSFIGRYRISMKSRKWYLRTFYHLLDMTIINSWLVYKDLKGTEATSSVLNLCQYRLELAEVLANINNASEQTNEEGPAPVTALKWQYKPRKVEDQVHLKISGQIVLVSGLMIAPAVDVKCLGARDVHKQSVRSVE